MVCNKLRKEWKKNKNESCKKKKQLLTKLK